MTKTDNQHATKHGGEGALRRMNQGKPFIGLAADEERRVIAEVAAGGYDPLVKRNAISLQTITDLYRDAVFKAAEAGDLAAFDRYVARYGWLSGVTLRALAQVAALEKDAAKGKTGAIDVLKAIKAARNDT